MPEPAHQTSATRRQNKTLWHEQKQTGFLDLTGSRPSLLIWARNQFLSMLCPTLFIPLHAKISSRSPRRAAFIFAVCLEFTVLRAQAVGQIVLDEPNAGQTATSEIHDAAPSKSQKLERLPIEWIIGPYIPVQGPLEPLSNSEREEIYVRQTFLTAGSYVARGFSAGLDQARGGPGRWNRGLWQEIRWTVCRVHRSKQLGRWRQRVVGLRTTLRLLPLSGILASHSARRFEKLCRI
jgi:hypothetical protein